MIAQAPYVPARPVARPVAVGQRFILLNSWYTTSGRLLQAGSNGLIVDYYKQRDAAGLIVEAGYMVRFGTDHFVRCPYHPRNTGIAGGRL